MPIRNGCDFELPQPATSMATAGASSAARALARISHHPDVPVSDRDRLGAHSHPDGADDAARRGGDAGDGVVDRPGHPDAAPADRNTAGAAADRNAPHDPIDGRIDLDEPIVELIGDPHGPSPAGDLGGREAD